MNQQSRDMVAHAPKQVPPPQNVARGIFVIQSTVLIRGSGEEGDPKRVVVQYFDKLGFLLAEDDPCETREEFHKMRSELKFLRGRTLPDMEKRLVEERKRIDSMTDNEVQHLQEILSLRHRLNEAVGRNKSILARRKK